MKRILLTSSLLDVGGVRELGRSVGALLGRRGRLELWPGIGTLSCSWVVDIELVGSGVCSSARFCGTAIDVLLSIDN